MHRSKRAIAIGVLTALWLAVAVPPVPAQPRDGPDAAQVLADYVAKPDSSYAWELRARYRERRSQILELQLHSQTWREVVWKHRLLLIKPANVAGERHGLLIVGGGRWRDSYEREPAATSLPEDARVFVAIAERLQTVVAVLGQVPYQPLFDLTEDRLIAYTFDRYLSTGDAEWPLLLPMVKSATRAMDASEAAALREWGMPLESFTVLGGSKRGWTTWLAAAVDRRVTALAPVVIDALNMARHFPYQTEVWGKPSEEIEPYTDLDLHKVLASDQGRLLRQIVDPFSYRTAITQPKLVVLATNDRYFPVDAANLYWDELSGLKYLLYLPNEQHSIESYARLIPTLDALHRSVSTAAPLPELGWEYRWASDAVVLCVRSDPAPVAVRTWMAASEDRDFRDAAWQAGPRHRHNPYVFEIPRPAAGYVAVFADAVFGRGRSAYSLSTNLAVLAPPSVEDGTPRPVGNDGVCAATGR